ncbi:hypothetical protein GSU68_14935 [Rathayibacter sp. VKM Ac-2759]|uniref:hypothetical protein n=1 Tax=Rathayibacter sp. VKM Ac-2759 TaxID=2609252 RepID=UPI001318548F|nr:hypothetical protein [Rathayibacter sp. VKM Ac-2759]QHC67732.1 hypothetical protein GSU68_14935 [Rathayibacter sp. VKM Ac-2759]
MSASQQDRATGIDEALASPADPAGDPGPGERSGLSSRIAEEILSGADDFGAEDFGAEPSGAAESGAASDGDDAAVGAPPAAGAAPAGLRAVEIDDPARAVGDDPENPIHGSMAAEFEAR